VAGKATSRWCDLRRSIFAPSAGTAGVRHAGPSKHQCVRCLTIFALDACENSRRRAEKSIIAATASRQAYRIFAARKSSCVLGRAAADRRARCGRSDGPDIRDRGNFLSRSSPSERGNERPHDRERPPAPLLRFLLPGSQGQATAHRSRDSWCPTAGSYTGSMAFIWIAAAECRMLHALGKQTTSSRR
jgi:hypothetical protein